MVGFSDTDDGKQAIPLQDSVVDVPDDVGPSDDVDVFSLSDVGSGDVGWEVS